MYVVLMALVACACAQDKMPELSDTADTNMRDTHDLRVEEVEIKIEIIVDKLDDQLDKVDQQLKEADELIEMLKAEIGEKEESKEPVELQLSDCETLVDTVLTESCVKMVDERNRKTMTMMKSHLGPTKDVPVD